MLKRSVIVIEAFTDTVTVYALNHRVRIYVSFVL